jgi:hypothetical protein
MKAKVIALNERGGKPASTIINEAPVKVGDVVEVDENTFRNLAKKGILEPADKEASGVDLTKPSRLSAEQAEEQIEERDAERKAAKKAADAAKKHD